MRSSLIVMGVYVVIGLGIISFIPNLLDNMEVNAVPLGITGSVWDNPPATLVPGVRVDSAMVQVGNGKMILFGGGNYDSISSYYNDTWSYDVSVNMWKNLQPPSLPRARSQHAMVFDESKGNVILFGGRSNADRFAETWAYNISTTKWTNLYSSPNPGYQRTIWHAMASAGNERVVLFGGEYASNQTWIYNLTSNTWFDAKPSSFPSGRSSVAMAFAGLGKVVMFGGGNNPLNVGETWIYDTMTNTWMNVTSSYGPNARYSHSMCYDDRSKNVILFGGKISAKYQSILFNDTWLFDTVNQIWKNVTSSYRPPISYYSVPMACDRSSGKAVLFSGGKTWVFDVVNVTWKDANPPSEPYNRYRHAMAYDEKSGDIVMYGGFGYTYFKGTTYHYNVLTNNWTLMITSPEPPRRYDHAMVSVSEKGIILFGGVSQQAVFNDLWRYDGSALRWENITPSHGPKPHWGHAMAYDSKNDKIVLFGGYSTSIDWTNETWIYDLKGNAWTNATTPFGPGSRIEHSMAYDEASGKVVLFGGFIPNIGLIGDTWTYDVGSNQWANQNTCPAPSARSGSSMIYAGNGRLLLFGGEDGSNYGNSETWVYDAMNGTWQNPLPAKHPKPRYNHAMAYDSRNGVVVLFGGERAWGINEQTWTYSGAGTDPVPPKIKSTSPLNGGVNVDLNAGVVVTFDHGMDPSSTQEAFSILPEVEGTVFVNGDTLTWSHTRAFIPNATYTVSISTTAKDLNGTRIAGECWFRFTVKDVPRPPRVVDRSPADGEVGVPVMTNITITFSERMDTIATAAAITSDPAIKWNFSWDNTHTLITGTPITELQPKTKYTITISTAAKSEAGIGLESQYQWFFTTEVEPNSPGKPTTTNTNIDLTLLLMLLIIVMAVSCSILAVKFLRRKRKRL